VSDSAAKAVKSMIVVVSPRVNVSWDILVMLRLARVLIRRCVCGSPSVISIRTSSMSAVGGCVGGGRCVRGMGSGFMLMLRP
jgi:hypothetical protein